VINPREVDAFPHHKAVANDLHFARAAGLGSNATASLYRAGQSDSPLIQMFFAVDVRRRYSVACKISSAKNSEPATSGPNNSVGPHVWIEPHGMCW
jgi:hypothetical protein